MGRSSTPYVLAIYPNGMDKSVVARSPRHRFPSSEALRVAVRRGWNRVSYRYRPRGKTSDRFGHTERDYRSWLGPIFTALPRGSAVLDLGSGTGVPAARILAGRYQVTGVDLSDVQVRRARRLVPGARFVRADMAEVDFPSNTFGAVVVLYSLFHLPRREHRRVLRNVRRWLVPGGWLLLIGGHAAYEGRATGWLGSDATMYWSHYRAATYRRWLSADGFRIVREQFVPEGEVGHELFLARKTGARRAPGTTGPGAVEASGRRARGPLRPSRARRPRGEPARPPYRSRSDGTPRKSG